MGDALAPLESTRVRTATEFLGLADVSAAAE
jgi:hypothetical protein